MRNSGIKADIPRAIAKIYVFVAKHFLIALASFAKIFLVVLALGFVLWGFLNQGPNNDAARKYRDDIYNYKKLLDELQCKKEILGLYERDRETYEQRWLENNRWRIQRIELARRLSAEQNEQIKKPTISPLDRYSKQVRRGTRLLLEDILEAPFDPWDFGVQDYLTSGNVSAPPYSNPGSEPQKPSKTWPFYHFLGDEDFWLVCFYVTIGVFGTIWFIRFNKWAFRMVRK